MDPSVIHPSRCLVELVVTSGTLSGPDLRSLLGATPDVEESVGDLTPSGAVLRESAWVLRASTADGASADEALSLLFPRAHRALSRLMAPSLADAQCLLRIVQYMRPGDDDCLGFVVDARWVAMLAAVNATIDVDQYLDER